MKIKIISFLVAITFLFGCIKKESIPADTYKSGIHLIALNGIMTPGELHNHAVETYIGHYGFNSTEMSYNDYKQATRRITLMLIDDGILSSNINVDSFTSIIIAFDFSKGIIKSDSTLATPEEFNYISGCISSNTDIRTVFNAMFHYTDNESDYLPYATAHLERLTGLTVREREGIDGVGSVLAGSYEIWAGKLDSETKAQIIWDADALGYWVYKLGLEQQGVPPQVADPIAAYQAAKISIKTAQFLEDK